MKKISELNLSNLRAMSCQVSGDNFQETYEYILTGELGFRLERSIHRIENELPYSLEYILSQISGTDDQWSNFPLVHGDIAGRWILALSTIYSRHKAAPPHLHRIVATVLSMQDEDGSFGAVSHQDRPLNMHKMYGNAWLLRGLIQYAAVFEDFAVREAAVKLGEYYKKTFPLWAEFDLLERDSGFYAITRSCFFHSFDGLIALSRLTGDDTYQKTAGSFIAYLTPLTESDHSHMYLTIRRGLIEYLVDTEAGPALSLLAEELKVVWNQFILETGGVPERFGEEEGAQAYDEGCSLFDWELICLRLYQLTREGFWMDAAILNLENQIYYNQCYNGGFGSFELGENYKQYGKEAPWCCSLFGPWGLAQSGSFFVEKHGGQVDIKHLVSGQWFFKDASSISMELLPENKQLRIHAVQGPNKTIKILSLYVPHWLVIKGQTPDVETQRIHLAVTDAPIILHFDYVLWVAEQGKAPVKIDAVSGRIANLFFGPYLLTCRSHETPTVDLSNTIKIRWLKGLNFYGEGYCITLKSNLKRHPNDVFLGLNDAADDLHFYCVKDKESPDTNKSKVIIK